MTERPIFNYDKNACRRAFVRRHVAAPNTILEIGALNSPVFKGEGVRLADWFTTEDLRAKYPNKKNVLAVDYVIDTPRFSSRIEERFDLIVANHVIEHVPDMIGWLGELAQLTTASGTVFMAVPDKRYTFDIIRPVTTLSHLIDCHHRQLDRPTIAHIFDHLYLHRKVKTSEIWAGREPDTSTPRISLANALEKASEMVKGYHSIHCHVFTCDSFLELFSNLEEAGLVRWHLQACEAPVPGSNEFLCFLKKK